MNEREAELMFEIAEELKDLELKIRLLIMEDWDAPASRGTREPE